ncbi:MAG: hypothetical protein HQL31_04170 [Planctomycetes bacterium]|nr:hypothetical protein [Planctomycetota bacterium]
MSDKLSKRLFSMHFSLTVSIVLLVVTTSLCVGIISFFSIKDFIRQGIKERMLDVAALATQQVNMEDHERLWTQEDETTEAYLGIRAKLQAIKSAGKDIRYIYTYRKSESGEISFVVDAETDPEEMSHVGDVYDDATPEMLSVFELGEGVVEDDFSRDEWGVWLSAFAPLFAKDGKVVGAVGLDVSAKAILDYEHRFLLILVVLCLAVCVPAIVLSIWFSSRVSRPLMQLAAEMDKVKHFDLSGGHKVETRITEVAAMNTALLNMKGGLRSFRKYVPADLVSELLSMGREASLSVEKRNVSVFFSDIADFTTISEGIGPENLVAHLGTYFEGMTGAIVESGGTVDKFIGDSIMAFWNAPLDMKDHAVVACRTALLCHRRSEEICRQWREQGGPGFQTRIGINTGDAMVGNMGYEERMSYTAFGDTVNIASRLESLNKYFNTHLIIGSSTYEQAQHTIEARFLDVVIVKGRKTGFRVYELLAEKGGISAEDREFRDLYESGMQNYLERN